MTPKEIIELFNNNEGFAEELAEKVRSEYEDGPMETQPEIIYEFMSYFEEDRDGDEREEGFKTFKLNGILFGFEGYSGSWDSSFDYGFIYPLEEASYVVKCVQRIEV